MVKYNLKINGKKKVQVKLLGEEVKKGEKDVSPSPFKTTKHWNHLRATKHWNLPNTTKHWNLPLASNHWNLP
jgi:hypothetical protein